MHIYLPIAEMSVSIYTLLFFGVIAGIVAGAFGLGGNFLLIPLLLSIGISSAVALSTALSQSVAAAASSFTIYHKNKHIDTKAGGFLLIGSITGVILGVSISNFLHNIGLLDVVISLLYIMLLGTMGCIIGRESILSLLHKKSVPSSTKKFSILAKMPWQSYFPITDIHGSLLTLILVGIIVGLIAAISGIGGGFIIIPMLIYVYKMPTIIAIGTSIYQIFFVAIAATAIHSLQSHTLDIVLSVILMIGSAIGAQIGHSLASRFPAVVLRLLLACIMLGLFCKLTVGLIITPQEPYSLDIINKAL